MAKDINKVVLIGRLTRDLGSRDYDFGYTSTGMANANISIASNRSVKRGEEWQEEVSYFEVKIWGKIAEVLKPYLLKGKQVCVEGYLQQDRWVEKETGNNKSRIIVVAENVQLLGGSKDGASSGGDHYSGSQSGGYQKPQYQYKQKNSDPNMGASSYEFSDDIPF